MKIIKQIKRFISVGVVATLVHVSVAMLVESIFNFTPQVANFVGFCSATGLSYLGHTIFTFDGDGRHAVNLPRFIVVAIAGLIASSVITYIVITVLNGPFSLAMMMVVVVVPSLTFLGLKFWAFSTSQSDFNER